MPKMARNFFYICMVKADGPDPPYSQPDLIKDVFLTTSLSIYNTNMIPVSANYLHCVIPVYHRIAFLGE